jgi:hypothetical protein
MAARMRNTFRRAPGGKAATVYSCDCCGRRTRNTGAQSIGSQLCPQCFDLAGIENEISDGHATLAEHRAQIDGLLAEIEAKGGTPREHFAALLAPAAEPRRSQREYDAAQTEKCNRLRAHLQSIALLAVQAQDLSGDPLTDLLDDIERDLGLAQRLNAALNSDDVYAEVR